MLHSLSEAKALLLCCREAMFARFRKSQAATEVITLIKQATYRPAKQAVRGPAEGYKETEI